MARDARERGAAAEELAALERLCALPADPVEPEALAPTLARLGELHARRRPHRRGRARGAAGAGAHAAPSDGAGGARRRAWPTRPASRELAELLAVRAEVETDFDVIVELLFRRAALYEGLGELRAAMQALRAAHRAAPVVGGGVEPAGGAAPRRRRVAAAGAASDAAGGAPRRRRPARRGRGALRRNRAPGARSARRSRAGARGVAQGARGRAARARWR